MTTLLMSWEPTDPPLHRSLMVRLFNPRAYPTGLIGPLAPFFVALFPTAVIAKGWDTADDVMGLSTILAAAIGLTLIMWRNWRTNVWVDNKGIVVREFRNQFYPWQEIRQIEFTSNINRGNTPCIRLTNDRLRFLPIGNVFGWNQALEFRSAISNLNEPACPVCWRSAAKISKRNPSPFGIPPCEDPKTPLRSLLG